MLTIGSIFSGIGGFELGFVWAGLGPVKWQVECDPYCLKILEARWPEDTKTLKKSESITLNQLTSSAEKHNLEPVDLICGGIPCQDISVAGPMLGLKGKRSGLWFEMFRIVRELRPRYILLECTPDTPKVRWIEQVLCDFASIGYDAEWTTISAKEVGAPHLRKRVFIVAYPEVGTLGTGLRESAQTEKRRGRFSDSSCEENMAHAQGERKRTVSERQGAEGKREADINGCSQRLSDTNSVNEDSGRHGAGPVCGKRLSPSRIRGCKQDVGVVLQSGLEREGLQGTITRAGCRTVESEFCGMADGVSPWLDDPADSGKIPRVATGVKDKNSRLRCLGNAVVPEIPYVIGLWIIEFEKGR